MLGTQQTEFFRTPGRENNGAPWTERSSLKCLGQFQESRRAGGIVVGAIVDFLVVACTHVVVMRTDKDALLAQPRIRSRNDTDDVTTLKLPALIAGLDRGVSVER